MSNESWNCLSHSLHWRWCLHTHLLACRPKCFLYGASKNASASYLSSLLHAVGSIGPSITGSIGVGGAAVAFVHCADVLGSGCFAVHGSCEAEVDGFGVDGADGVDVPDVEAGLPFSHSLPIILPPARPWIKYKFQIQKTKMWS